jgi:hypothetical protein
MVYEEKAHPFKANYEFIQYHLDTTETIGWYHGYDIRGKQIIWMMHEIDPEKWTTRQWKKRLAL